MRHQVVLETESKTESWLRNKIAMTISYISIVVSSWESQDWRGYGPLSAKVTQ